VDDEQTSLLGRPARYRRGLSTVAEGVHAWLQPNGEVGESNAGLVVGAGESLLVDTLWDLRLTSAMLQAMASHTGTAPIGALVNTHGDGDHCWGNQLVEAQRIASRATAADIAADAPSSWRALAGLGRALRPLARLDHPPRGLRTAGAVARLAGQLSAYRFSGIRLSGPDRTFEGELTVEVGGRQVRLLELGPAHTPGDVVVHVPDAATIFTGDLVFAGVAPIMWVGPVENWIAALDRIIELGPRVVVPGHGPLSDLDAVHAMREYWDFTAVAVRRLVTAGVPPVEAATRIVHSAAFGRQPFAGWSGHERLAVSAHVIARSDRGGTGRVPPAQRLRLLTRLATLAADLQP
jgi:cyclase